MKLIAIFTLVIWCVGVESLPGVREKRETKDCSSALQSLHRSKRYQVFYKGKWKGKVKWNGKGILINGGQKWQESREACQALGGDLAELSNRQEKDKISAAIANFPVKYRKYEYLFGTEKIWAVIGTMGPRENSGFTRGYVCKFESNESMDEGVEFCNNDN